MPPSSDIAFTPTVKALQVQRGSRASYARIEERGGFRTAITADLAEFLTVIDTAYLATVNAAGQPYAQHRGGPRGFIRVVDDATLGFADYTGNRQYITTGNLADNDQAFLFLMDYANRRRIKLWGRARVVADDQELIDRLMPENYKARPEQAILFEVLAWDVNCPQHIPRKLDAGEVAGMISSLEARITDRGKQMIANMTGDFSGTVSEDVVVKVIGKIVVTDDDLNQNHTRAQTGKAGTYGTFNIDTNGNWTYALNHTLANSLVAGDIRTETFSVLSTDGSATQSIIITINGTNDLPTITGTRTGAVIENKTLSASGKITVADPDRGQSHTVAQVATAGAYGTFKIDANGNWVYTLTNALANSLQLGEKHTETFAVQTTDGTTRNVVVTVTGTNDAPTITGTFVGAVNDGLLDGSGGSDTLNIAASFTSASDAQIANIENILLTAASTLILTGQTEGFAITGSSGNDSITGGGAADTINGGGGTDSVTGGAGIDTFNVTAGTVTITDLGNGGAEVLTVSAGATVAATASAAWTATASTSNAGTASVNANGFAVTGAGGLVIASTIVNDGVLRIHDSTLTTHGAISGAGIISLEGHANITLEGADSNAIILAGDALSRLEIGDPIAGAISGFDANDTFDFTALHFTLNSAVSYVANNQGTGGILTVTDGNDSSQITLIGSYDASQFHLAGDVDHSILLTYGHDVPQM